MKDLRFMQSHDKSLWIRLLDAGLEELIEMESTPQLPPELKSYLYCLMAFHRGDLKALRKEIDRLSAPQSRIESRETILLLAKIREQLISSQIDLAWIQSVAKQPPHLGQWQGELSILLATALFVRGRYSESRELYLTAAREFMAEGAELKALRCEFNAIATLSNIDPERKLMPEFFYLYRKAKKLGQNQIAATALLNLSREYQRMGAYRIALKFCSRAIASCRDCIGGQIYFLSIAHRAHLLFQLGRPMEASIELEQAKTSSFPDVQIACRVLEEIIGEKNEDSKNIGDEDVRLINWRERLQDARSGAKTKTPSFSPLEEKLIRYISDKPRDKFDIYENVFGRDVHPFTAENRLKSILGRIRKKSPGLIVHESGKYSIADVGALPIGKTRAG